MAKWQRTKIEIPEEFSPAQREELAFEILEFIRNRTQAGKDKKNRKFPGYSKDYINSVDFTIGGKSSGQVNLTLSGDMLDAMDLLSHKKGQLLIGFENGSDENARAEGNILGTYGQSSPIKGKKRDFLGITKKDLAAVVNKYRRENG